MHIWDASMPATAGILRSSGRAAVPCLRLTFRGRALTPVLNHFLQALHDELVLAVVDLTELPIASRRKPVPG